MKIIKLSAENVKKLKAVEITPKGNVVRVTGKNGSGKSSTLDSIYYALAGTSSIPGKPVRDGQESAKIRLDMGEIIVTRKFSANGGTSLTVESASGARFPSPQRMLDELLGSLSFDPLAFSRMAPKEQLAAVRGLVKLDVDVDALTGRNKTDYESRTEINRDIKRMEGQLAGIMFPATTPDEPLDTGALVQELESAGTHNAEIDKRKDRRTQAAADIQRQRGDAVRIRGEAAELRKQAQDLLTQADAKAGVAGSIDTAADDLQTKLESAETLPEPIDTAVVREKIAAAEKTNVDVAAKKRAAEMKASLEQTRAQAETLTNSMQGRTDAIAAAITAAKMPVEGLSFGEGVLLYKGLPFDQASSAEQLRASIAIAISANPKLRVLRVKDGSLLDEEGMKLLSEMADADDMQVWIEAVDSSGKLGIFMEDGAVAAVDGVKTEAEPERTT